MGIYVLQVRFQVGFQVEQDAGHLESDLLSPVLSLASENSVSGRALLISSDLYSIVVFGVCAQTRFVEYMETYVIMPRLLSSS